MPRESRPAFDLERHVFYWITQVIGSRDRMLAQELKAAGLRVPGWRVLASLSARRRCSMSELADIATIDRTTLTRTVDRMQHAGWVARISDSDDMRVTRLALTAAGERMFARIWPAVERLNRAAVAGMTPADVGALRATLKRMKGNLDQGLAGDERAA
jgi:DNA-binding MarR family transcriptional regulator